MNIMNNIDETWNNDIIIDDFDNNQTLLNISNSTNNLLKLELFDSNLPNELSKEKKMSLLIVVLLQMIFSENSEKLDQIYSILNKKNILDIDVTKNKYSSLRSNLSFMIDTLNKNNSTINIINNKYINKYRNNYNQINLLGQGSYGSVYKVYHKFEKKMYALKKIFITEDLIEDKFDIFREVQIYANLEHQNIVKYYSSWVDIDVTSISEYNKMIGEDEDGSETITKLCPILFIQMELCDTTLKEYMLSTMEDDCINIRINYFKQIIDGIEYLHKNNIMHRDLKPDNIFIVNGIIKIGDFGLCTNNVNYEKLAICSMSDDVGTSIYASPEIKSGHYGYEVDIYSMGIILLELLLKYSTIHEKMVLISGIKKNGIGMYSENMLSNKYNNIISFMIGSNVKRCPNIYELKDVFIKI